MFFSSLVCFQQSTSMVLIAVCLFATVYSALGMRTVYYRDGRICDVCTDNRDDVVPYKQSYTPEEAGKRVIYSGGQDRINSRPIISPSSSSSSYIVDRGDYSSRKLFFIHFLFCLFSVICLFMSYSHLFVLLDVIWNLSSFNTNININIKHTFHWTQRLKWHLHVKPTK